MPETTVLVLVEDKKARVRRAWFDPAGKLIYKEFLRTNGSWAVYHDEFPEDSELDMQDRRVEAEMKTGPLVVRTELMFDNIGISWAMNIKDVGRKIRAAMERNRENPSAVVIELSMPSESRNPGNLYGIPFTVRIKGEK